jgi:hypothetical protein
MSSTSKAIVNKKTSEERKRASSASLCKKVTSSSPSPSIPLCLIRSSIDALRNTRLISSSDSKEPAILFDPVVLGVFRSLFSVARQYSFRLSRISSLINGTAILSVNIATDLTTFSEGAALSALFDEVKLVETQWTLVSVAHTTQFSFISGYEPVVNTSTPTPTNIGRLPLSELSTTFCTNKVLTRLRYRAPSDALFGLVSDEGVASPRICSGLNGTFSICNVSGTPTTAETDFSYQLLTVGRFRKRG